MASDLDQALNALFTKEQLERHPPFFILHRFLASERDLAVAARYLQRDLKEQGILFRTWQGLLPKAKGAPRFGYVAPKKGPEAEALVARMMEVHSERRQVIEEMLEIFALLNRTSNLYDYYGIEPPKDHAD